MGDKSAIEWTDATWNPIVGCSIVSPGCANCYAMGEAARQIRCAEGLKRTTHYAGTVKPSKTGPVWTGEIKSAPDHIWTAPLRWKKPRKVFVNSMGDLFHESIDDDVIDRAFAIMALAPQHQFQVLTKRAERMRAYMTELVKGPWAGRVTRIGDDNVPRPETDVAWRLRNRVTGMLKDTPSQALNRAIDFMDTRDGGEGDGFFRRWPLPNVWLGVSAERQKEWDERVEHLGATPAAIRFVSVEPILGPIDAGNAFDPPLNDSGYQPIDWIICGGESGPRARPMHPDWARSLRDQCQAAGVPFLFKQWGEHWPAELIRNDHRPEPWRHSADGGEYWFIDEISNEPPEGWPAVRYSKVGKKRAGRTLDGRTWDQWPEAPA